MRRIRRRRNLTHVRRQRTQLHTNRHTQHTRHLRQSQRMHTPYRPRRITLGITRPNILTLPYPRNHMPNRFQKKQQHPTTAQGRTIQIHRRTRIRKQYLGRRGKLQRTTSKNRPSSKRQIPIHTTNDWKLLGPRNR